MNRKWSSISSYRRMIYPKKKNNVTKLINRRNKHRKYIVNSDENGNYCCDFGKLIIIPLGIIYEKHHFRKIIQNKYALYLLVFVLTCMVHASSH